MSLTGILSLEIMRIKTDEWEAEDGSSGTEKKLMVQTDVDVALSIEL